ncbi:MAG: rhodanese-like domain-containing protein [Gemmataceae bacterium]
MTAVELKAKLDAGQPVQLLDVRNDDERAFCRIEPSQFIPLHELVARVAEIEAKEGVPLVVYCHHGVRSLRAAMFLAQSGISPVFSLSGGIEAWSVQVDPTVKRY